VWLEMEYKNFTVNFSKLVENTELLRNLKKIILEAKD
jgi:hypothetical protein